MITREDIEFLKRYLSNIEILYDEYTSDYDEDIDYEDVKKQIYDLQSMIKSITSFWEE